MKVIDRFGRENNSQINISRSGLVRILLKIAGAFFIGLAIIAIFLPLLPTTPFLLLAAACYARSSKKLPDWLLHNRFLDNKWFGVYVKDYLEGRGIPLKIKILFVLLVAIAAGCSAIFIDPTFIKRMLLAIIVVGISVYILVFIPTVKSEDIDQ